MSHSVKENKKINLMLAHGNKCCKIAEEIGCNPPAFAKEIKRNRVNSKYTTKD